MAIRNLWAAYSLIFLSLIIVKPAAAISEKINFGDISTVYSGYSMPDAGSINRAEAGLVPDINNVFQRIIAFNKQASKTNTVTVKGVQQPAVDVVPVPAAVWLFGVCLIGIAIVV